MVNYNGIELAVKLLNLSTREQSFNNKICERLPTTGVQNRAGLTVLGTSSYGMELTA